MGSGGIADRLKKFMKEKRLNANQITVSANLSVGLIGKVLKKGTSISQSTIEKILHAFPELNPAWLVSGEGEMFVHPDVHADVHPEAKTKNQKYRSLEKTKVSVINESEISDKQRIAELENQLTIYKSKYEALLDAMERLGVSKELKR